MEKRRFRTITLFADIVILAISFLLMVWTKPASLRHYLPSHSLFFAGLAVVWLAVSLINGKMHRGKIINFSSLFNRVIGSNLISIAIIVLAMYTVRELSYSRTIVLGTAVVATILELIFGMVFIAYRKASLHTYEAYERYKSIRKPSEAELVDKINEKKKETETAGEINPRIVKAIGREAGPQIADAIIRMTGPKLSERTAVLSTTTIFNIRSLPEEKYSYIINLHKINDIGKLDDFIDSVNEKLEDDGYFFCCVETKDQRKRRILKKYPFLLNYLFYFFDFMLKRVFPKLKITRPVYMTLTRGNNMVLSRAEALGRLSRGGFRIRQESFIGNLLCIESKKTGVPIPQNGNLYGPLIALPRIGKEGKIIKVYKLRTMHPYSEFIQDYIYRMHDLQDGGKFRNDFRITSWGAVCRKIWLDEFPMLINWFKGEMKLVGVRPLSRQYFELYSDVLKERRVNYKPGLIPPFYADLPEDLEGIQASEMRYLDNFDKRPFLTDLRYFFKSLWNILFYRARSK